MKIHAVSPTIWAVTVLGAAGLLLSPAMSRPVHACGGFWCSQSAPVNQRAEQIIFVDNPDKTVTAIIQISYVGPSTKFAWVIPIPGKPDIAVSSNIAFQNLEVATAPQYTLERHLEGTCMPQQYAYDSLGGPRTAGTATADAGAAAPAPAVIVIEEGSVGPYDYEVISLDPALPNPADVATQWFTMHGYDLTGVDGKLLGPYLQDGLNLLAFKLTKGNMTGSIRPVMLTYESKLPMIPIRPTAVAAQDDMGIRVWVSAMDQAVPENYKSLVINEALIDWFNYNANYDQVVTAAANEAMGQGFVTELAGPTDTYKDVLYPTEQQQAWKTAQMQTFADGIDAITAANQYFRGWDGWREAITNATTLPAGVTIDQFGRTPDQYRGQAKVDIAKFFAEIDDKVIKPVTETQRLINTMPYLTRLYSTMSADEMTVDPAFTYNGELANVSNKHVAKQFIQCNPSINEYEAPWRIELPQGGVIRGKGTQAWPVVANSMPANLKIVELSTTGPGKVLEDNSGKIGDKLFKAAAGMMPSGAAIPPAPAMGMMIGGDQVVSVNGVPVKSSMPAPAAMTRGGGCSVSASSARGPAWSMILLLGGVLALRTRRRRC